MAERCLIVNADDFGRSPGINRGVIRAHAQGIVTSASLMVRHGAVVQAVAAARQHPALGLGLHLDFGEWEYRDGEWHTTYEVVDTEDAEAVAMEADRQLARFRALVGHDPTHLDSHQHVHRDEPVRSVAAQMAQSLAVPLRHQGAVRYCGAFHGHGRQGLPVPDAICPESLISIVQSLPEGFTELCCHPAEEVELRTSYAAERRTELESLRDVRVRRAVERAGVRLCSFGDVAVR